ncbi:copper amine oxidase N-terminal domain-containing protein [Natranaerofaba carboxydovora]|uniref:copper amine oxidase N-terminal domain-containing protein n=1 Tax=Natranaerofaba carboxydovora TaxID=2742683 RepID=UPI001F1362AB|nr:copper amine oxidase N-terminal domain-containing protein [Natranaerofaba carboxydovora]UMZ74955.1 hypothetical protein ACONDI_02561 [Natranaerofaba carboxydovora]
MKKKILIGLIVVSLMIFNSGAVFAGNFYESLLEQNNQELKETLMKTQLDKLLEDVDLGELDFDINDIDLDKIDFSKFENIELEKFEELEGLAELEELLKEENLDEIFKLIEDILDESDIDLGELKDKGLEERIFVRGEQLEFGDVLPVIRDGRVLLPLRATSEALGAKVDWDGENRVVTVERDDILIELEIGNNVVIVNGEEREIDVPASIENGRTLVPLRFVSEILGDKVDYDEETGEINID